MFDFENEDWRTTDINVEDLWIIDKRDSSGKNSNIYHGNFVPQIPYQLIKRYTQKGETVLDIFTGSGTTLFECEKLERNFIGFDINEAILNFVKTKMGTSKDICYSLQNCDNTNTKQFNEKIKNAFNVTGKNSVDFLIAHPPYLDIVKFTNQEEDLSNISDTNIFLDKFIQSMKNGLNFLTKGKYFAVVIGDVYKKSEVVPLGFYLMDVIKRNFKCKLKGIIIKNIEGNRGKIGSQSIWKYRALKNDYFIFKHEYIFLFKKEF